MRRSSQTLLAALGDCDLSSLEALAEYHEAVAREFRDQARQRRTSADARKSSAGRLEQMATIPAVYANFAAVMSHDAAVNATMQTLGVPLETVLAWLKKHRRDQATAQRHKRKMRAVELMRTGSTNAAIARHLGISTGAVSRLLRGERRSSAKDDTPRRTPGDLDACMAADAALERGHMATYIRLKRVALG